MENVQDNSEQDLTIESSDPSDFFSDLEQQVNGSIVDDVITDVVTEQAQPSATLEKDPEPQTEQPDIWESDENPYKKRHSDSSREGKRLAQLVKEDEKYRELINVMKNDPGAAQAVLNHISGKKEEQQASNPRELFGLDKEFVFDMDDALDNPNSDSASVMNNWITTVASSIVEDKVKQIEAQQQEANKQAELKTRQQQFMQEKNWTKDQFDNWMGKVNEALSGGIDYKHLDKIVSEGEKAENIANSTRQQVMNQMKNVSQYPNTVSSANSISTKERTPDDAVWDVVRNVDRASALENLFE